MSSFKRKAVKQNLAPGTRLCPSSPSTVMTSTGIPSLDDILGGGLPLSCTMLCLAPDSHSAYGELVQKYFIAQGLASEHNLCIVDDNSEEIVKECMWTLDANTPADEQEPDTQTGDMIKIAWRYEQMKKFQTTVPSATPSMSTEEYCCTFELTRQVPETILRGALSSGKLTCLRVSSDDTQELSTIRIIRHLSGILETRSSPVAPLRICITSLGSPQWGDLSNQQLLHFMQSLQTLIHGYPHACASISFAPALSTSTWGGPGWIEKLGWLSDAAITLSAFTANPSLSTQFPGHHGFLHVHTLPAPHTLLPPSDKFSTLRGLSSSGENNLAFKCTRKRLVFETLHLDLEGGVGERRTTPSTVSEAPNKAIATVQIEVDGTETKRPRKKVAFHSDRPELYDF